MGGGGGGGYGGGAAPAPGAPGAPAARGPSTGGAPRGIPIDFRRLESSKDRLKVEWQYPVYVPEVREVEEGRTTTEPLRAALPRERALVEIRAEDHRPLLVLRECTHCRGTDHALLDRRLDNEKTLILTKWFRCVKLPEHVLEEDHPFRNLFDGEKPPHLFLCRHDGTDAVTLDGQQTQSQLWDALISLIEDCYVDDPEQAVKRYLRVLDAYDSIDSRESEIRRQLEETLDDDGPRAPRVRTLQRKLDKLAKERAEVAEREKHVIALELKPLPDAAGSR
jgi:hypothetical protein